jgi:tRNA modification GTPase
LQGELAELRSLVEADIDFAEEPIEFISAQALCANIEALHQCITDMLASARAAERIDTLPQVLLLGLPNAGKSTLLNRLSGIDRAIASAVAGATRDLLTAPASFGGVAALLVDSAGWDEHGDEISTAAGERSMQAAQSADVVCLVVDASQTPDAERFARITQRVSPGILAANKLDLLDAAAQRRRERELAALVGNAHPTSLVDSAHPAHLGHAEIVWMSALAGTGVEALRSAIAARLASDESAGDDVQIALSASQRTSLSDAAEALGRARKEAAGADEWLNVAELVAADLGDAQDALGELTGEVTTEDLLARIFSSFCIGK